MECPLVTPVRADRFKAGSGMTVSVVTGREMYASGNGYEVQTKEIDLCNGCVCLAVQHYQPVIDRLRPRFGQTITTPCK